MSKAIKRQSELKLNQNSSLKFSKFYDLKLITKDVSMLETFYDFIDGEKDVINEYLSSHDFNDFLNYFKLYQQYNSSEFSLVFKVCAEILMRIADDLNEKYSLIGQNFVDLFIENYISIIHKFMKSNTSKTALKACIKFVTGLILQGSEGALKMISPFNLLNSNFSKQLSVRNANVDDVHTCVLNCFASFYMLGNNSVVRKLCENIPFISTILKDLRFDKYDNVVLIIEILHEKIIKNNSISKTLKVKLFNSRNLQYLIGVYGWKGEAQSYEAFKTLNEIDERSLSLRSQLHQLLMDIFSHHFGIVFKDNLLGQSNSHMYNKSLLKLITSVPMNDFFTFNFKYEIVLTILKTCPDLVSKFIEYLAVLMRKIVPNSREEVLKVVVQCFKLIENEKIDNILTDTLNYMNGEKFTDVAIQIFSPTSTLIEIINTTDRSNEVIMEIKDVLKNNCGRVFTWINVSEHFESIEHRTKIKVELQEKIIEILKVCEWNEEFEILLLNEYKDKTLFTKIKTDNQPHESKMDQVQVIQIDEIEDVIKPSVDILMKVNVSCESVKEDNACAAFKNCMKYFIASPFSCKGVVRIIADTLCKGKVSIKKKQKKKLFDIVATSDVISEHCVVLQSQDESYEKKEFIRECIFDIIVSCVDSSSNLMTSFYETIHPLRLLNVYGGTLSQCDQKILYLLSIHQLYDIPVSSYDVILFGNIVNKHYHIESHQKAVLYRPVIDSQCLNLFSDERIIATINHFPISRMSPVSTKNKFNPDNAQPFIYDPCFLLEWITQLLAKDSTDEEFVINDFVELKTLYSKHIVQFLVVCQSSQCAQIRLVSKILLGKFLERLEDYENEANDFQMRMQVQMIIYHMFNTLSTRNPGQDIELPSIFTNIYVRMLQLLNTPDKKMFSPLWEMLISIESFDLKYVPDFLFMMFSDKEDYRTRQLWCLQLLSDSVKTYEDFRVLLNTKVFSNVTSLFSTMEARGKTIILTLIKRCVAIVKVAESLRKFPGFITWLISVSRNRKEKENKQTAMEIIDIFLHSLKDSKNFDEFETVLKIDL